MRALMSDLGLEVKIRIHSDASAAIGIARRRGVGKSRLSIVKTSGYNRRYEVEMSNW